MSFTVREARSDADWEQACELLRRVYVGEGYTTAERADQFQRREVLDREGAFLIAIGEDGRVIGATLFLHEGSPMHQIARLGEREFRVLAVDPGARGEGVGEALVRECIRRAVNAGAAGLVLWTQPTMHAAQRLYERLGFHRATERDQPDTRGFTRFVYKLSLLADP
jgi:ribosomal protein S18 acetylase RimI-like enzyme